jgi:GDPmannose 4,6-dehydratase
MRRALITGISGQDGSYLTAFLRAKGYEIHGIIHRTAPADSAGMALHVGDLADGGSIDRIVAAVRPDEIYHLAAQSGVLLSFDVPELTFDVNAHGTLRLLVSARAHCPAARIFLAGSSEMFGSAPAPQSELTPFRPQSPYAVSKLAAFHAGVNFREAHRMRVWNGILFNHDSPRRCAQFMTRKVTQAAARIKLGLQDRLLLGNLDARRDWGFAGDYVEAMWLMLQQDVPGDICVATGEDRSVREFVARAFAFHGMDWTKYVAVDHALLRPTESPLLRGDAARMRALGWAPRVGFADLVDAMAAADLAAASSGSQCA